MDSVKVLRYARDIALFAPCYVALDWASFIEPIGPFNITPWDPQPALAIVWMMLRGFVQMPAVFASIVLADVIVRHAPGGYLITLTGSAVLACAYAAMAWGLKNALREGGLRSARDLSFLATLIILGSGLVSAAYIGLLNFAGVLLGVSFKEAALQFWVGDAVGILVTAPFLLVAADESKRVALLALARRPESWLQVTILVVTLWLIFEGLAGNPTHLFYLLFVPAIWIAMRSGLGGAIVAMAIVQIGVLIGINRSVGIDLSILEMQVLVTVLTLTGLFLGIVVDEHQRAEATLRQSLRLAAAGEMAGAIAHEVNQPLTALTNYAQSARHLISAGDQSRNELHEVVTRMLSEANRAADIVRRVRDFFRTGSTHLEIVEVADLLATIRRLGQQTIGARTIRLEAAGDGALPPLLVDRLQVELILNNLLVNAVDSLVAASREGALIRIVVARHDRGLLRVTVADNGPGVAETAREQVFEPFVSGKPSGMGLGLAVSRAMAEAHGGSLSVVAAAHGEFQLVLPCATNP